MSVEGERDGNRAMTRRSWIIAVGSAVAAGMAIRWCRRRQISAWLADGTLLEGRSGHVAVLLDDGGVLVACGHAPDDQILSSAERRTPTGAWMPAAALSTPRSATAAVRLSDGRVLVVGGWTPGGATASAEIWDPTTDTWSSTAALSVARSAHAAVRLADGTVLVAGGFSADVGFLTQTELYDPATEVWSPAGALSLGRVHLSLTLLADQTVLAAGGDGADDVGVTICERYDPATSSWSLTGPLSTGRSHDDAGGAASTPLGDGRVLIAGGFRLQSGSSEYLDSAEIYEPMTGSWFLVAPMPGPGRVLPAAAMFDDGSGLVVGGWTGDIALADAFQFDPVLDAWSTLPTLTTARAFHTATVLPSGDVLVVGGFTTGGQALTTERLVRRAGCCGAVRAS